MDPLPDFGLFELLGAAILGRVARKVYSRPTLGLGFLLLSVAAPVAIIVLGRGELTKWLGALGDSPGERGLHLPGVALLGAGGQGVLGRPTGL